MDLRPIHGSFRERERERERETIFCAFGDLNPYLGYWCRVLVRRMILLSSRKTWRGAAACGRRREGGREGRDVCRGWNNGFSVSDLPSLISNTMDLHDCPRLSMCVCVTISNFCFYSIHVTAFSYVLCVSLMSPPRQPQPLVSFLPGGEGSRGGKWWVLRRFPGSSITLVPPCPPFFLPVSCVWQACCSAFPSAQHAGLGKRAP